MMTALSPLSSVDLQSMIDHNPLIVAPTMRVQEAIARMSETGSSCVLVVPGDDSPSPGSGLIGILTEHDLVRLWTQPTPLDQIQVQAVMSQPVITLKASDFTDIRVALTLFQQHQSHHLPVLDEGDRLLGLLRQDTLTEQLAQAVLQVESQTVDIAEINQAHQRALITAIPDLIMRINQAGIYLEFIAPPQFRVVGNLPELVGTHVSESLPPELAQKRIESIQQALQTNSIQIYEQDLSRDDITQIEEVRIVPYSRDEVLALVRDISDRKRIEAERQAAEAALQTNEQFLRSIYEGVDQAIFTLDVLANGELRYVAFNPAAEQISGKSTEEIRGNTPGEKVRQHYLDCLQAGTSISYEECLVFQDQPTWWLTTLNPIRDASSRICRIVGTSTNITERKQAEALLELQNAILERIAKAEPLPEILDALLQAMELQLVNSLCSIMLCDRAGKLHCEAATRLPKPYLQACEGIAIGEGVGSCGTAAFRGEPVVVSDIATDPLWQNFKDLALEHGLRACWSVPVIASDGRVLGTFAVYHREPYIPDAPALEVVTLAANIAGIAIEREQATQSLQQLNQELERRVEERTTALQASEERWQLVLRGTNDGIWDWDLTTNKLFFSSRWKQMRGSTDEEIGDSPDEYLNRIHPDDYDRVMVAIDHHFAGRSEFFEVEYRTQHKDGSYLWVLDRGQALRDTAGQVIRISGSETDITQRKQAEDALRESQRFLQTVLDTFPLSIFWKDRHSVYLGCNRNFLQDAGLVSVAEIIGKTDYGLPWSQAEAEAYRADDQQVMNTNTAKLGIIETLNKADGNQIWLETNKLPLHNLMGEVIGVLGTYQDISQRKRLEAELAESEAKFRHLVEGGHDLIWAQDTEGRFTYLSPQFQTLFGWEPQEWIGKLSIDLLHPDDVRHRENIGKSNREFRHRHRDGHYVWVSTTPTLILNAEGVVVGRQGTLTDISDRKAVEKQLQLTQYSVDNAVEGILWINLDFSFSYANQAACRMLGYSLEELLQLSVGDIDPDWTPEMYTAVWDPHEQGSTEFVIESRHRTKDGRIYPVEVVGNFHMFGGQTFKFVRVRDISERARLEAERKQTEEALRLSEERFRNAFDNTAVGMCLVSLEGQYVKANAAFCRFLGYSEAELLERRFHDITHPDDLPANLELVRQILAREIHSYHLEKRYFTQSGQVVWGLLSVSLIQDADAQPLYFVAQIQDITERKRLEQEQSRLLALLEGSTDYILIADVTGAVIWNNAALKQLRGLESDAAVIQQRATDYYSQWAVELLEQQAVPTAIATGSWLGETVVLDAEGQEIPVSQLLLAHKSLQGEVEFFSTIMRDVRVRKEYEQRLEQTNAELLRATRLKDEFLANMSHELRTPLTAILGMSELLKEQIFGELNAKQHQYIEIISNSGKHLLRLINDILDVSKISAGKLDLDISSISINDLCTSSLVFIKQDILKKQIQLTTTLPTNLENIEVDERRMRQVLINLLSNAVKFTPTGGQLTLEVRIQDSGSDELDSRSHAETNSLEKRQDSQANVDPDAWILLSVIDTGIGITPEDQAKLFKPFVQIDSSLNRKYEGTGLGLALVKQIVELHGGSISLTSQLGQGSCFTVRLPYHRQIGEMAPPTSPQFLDASPTPAVAAETTIAEPLAGNSPLILLAEDNQSIVDLLSNYLEVCSYQILIANNGQEAIELAQAHSPDLILMDIQMPDVNGLDAIQTIRQDPQLAQIPIIALTALVMEGDRDRCLDAGATDYFTKPVKLRELSRKIQQLLGL